MYFHRAKKLNTLEQKSLLSWLGSIKSIPEVRDSRVAVSYFCTSCKWDKQERVEWERI